MKRLIKNLTVIVVLLFIYGCSEKELDIDDKLQFEIQNVNEEELQLLMNSSGNFTKQEIEQYYAVVALDYEIENGKKFSNLTVKHDFNWDTFMDSIDLENGQMYMNGDGFSKNFNNGSFKSYSDRFIFYAKDFSKEELQSIFEKYKLNLSWENADGELVEETILIGDFLEDKRRKP